VLEDVRREARILRILVGSEQPPLSTASIDGDTCGLSTLLVTAINLPSNAVVVLGAVNPLTVAQQFLDSIAKGRSNIAEFYKEVDTEVNNSTHLQVAPLGLTLITHITLITVTLLTNLYFCVVGVFVRCCLQAVIPLPDLRIYLWWRPLLRTRCTATAQSG
jgi:hypothetical protein